MSRCAVFDVSREIVVITGACGQLGMSYQKAFLDEGSIVVGVDIFKSDDIIALEAQYGERYLFQIGDITSKDSLTACLVQIVSDFGTPTVLINNAAIDSPPDAPLEETGPFEGYPEASWDKVIEVNLKGTFFACQIFGAAMAEVGSGSIINVSSIYGLVAPDQNIYEFRRKRGESFYKPVAYSASKSGVLNLTRYLAVYWADKNVRVNSLTIAGVFNNQEKDFLEAYCDRIPIGRMAAPDEYNGSMIYLASQASSYVTGTNLIVDGGWTAI